MPKQLLFIHCENCLLDFICTVKIYFWFQAYFPEQEKFAKIGRDKSDLTFLIQAYCYLGLPGAIVLSIMLISKPGY